MPRFFFHIAYNGTAFHGWQVQPDAPSIQEEITNALTKLNSNVPIEIVGCGRTDAGVHAANYYFHADIERLNLENLKYKLNKMLPDSIAVFDVFPVLPSLHARFDAKWRTYRYFIHQQKDPFKENQSWYFSSSLDIDSMNFAASLLVGDKDFTSFARLHTDVKTNRCVVRSAQWTLMENNKLVFEITANRFLRNMVRAIVGTLIDVGQKKLAPHAMTEILQAKDRQEASISAPACGLFLWNIEYEAFGE